MINLEPKHNLSFKTIPSLQLKSLLMDANGQLLLEFMRLSPIETMIQGDISFATQELNKLIFKERTAGFFGFGRVVMK
jgi:hypothetical protein